MRGALRVTLRLFNRSVPSGVVAHIGGNPDPETIKYVADQLRQKLGSPDFPWEKMIEDLHPEEAWGDAVENYFGMGK